MEVVTFLGYRPPARYDAKPWTQVRIEEASAIDGTYTALETIALSPLDSDPAHPAARSFTTEKGTALDYWYRVVFLDATGDISQPTSPVQNIAGGGPIPAVVAYADVAELQLLLRIDSPTPTQTAAMQRALDEAAEEINWELGYTTDTPAPTPTPALVIGVNLDRAVEHWRQSYSPFGVIGIGSENEPVVTARNSWYRHHLKLQPLKHSQGIA